MVASSQTAREERAIVEIDRLGSAGLSGIDLLRRTIDALRPVLHFDAWCATTTDPGSNLITDAITQRESGSQSTRDPVSDNYFSRVYFEHDYEQTLAMVRQRLRVQRLSDAAAGDLSRSARYQLHLAPRHLGAEVYTTLVDRGLWGELHLTREQGYPEFSNHEIDFLNRIAPRIGSALKGAAFRATASSVTEHDAFLAPGVLILDRDGRVMSSTGNVEGYLREISYLDPAWRSGRGLPVALQVILAALERTISPVAHGDPYRVPRLRVRAQSGRWLTFDASLTEATADRASERVVVIGPAPSEEIAWLSLAALELSKREEDVIRQVVRGLSTRQIADELFITEHTVQRHLSNIFEKVGVRSRRELVKQLFFEQVLPSLN
jgi:DNA-binding CsgD family transcriptional regulator